MPFGGSRARTRTIRAWGISVGIPLSPKRGRPPSAEKMPVLRGVSGLLNPSFLRPCRFSGWWAKKGPDRVPNHVSQRDVYTSIWFLCAMRMVTVLVQKVHDFDEAVLLELINHTVQFNSEYGAHLLIALECGPSGGTRTRSLVLPKHAVYHWHTPGFNNGAQGRSRTVISRLTVRRVRSVWRTSRWCFS